MSTISDLRKQICDINQKIISIQTKCSHPEEAVEEHQTMWIRYLDLSRDCYWIDKYCTLCEKSWRENH